MFNEILELTKKLVSINSVNGSEGEKNIGLFIERYLREIPYFKEHPEQVIVQKLKDDKFDRRNVIALLKCEKKDVSKTIIFHGHTDTVGVEDYGNLKEYAFDCDELMKKLDEVSLDEEVYNDLKSGDYLFGRGSCDMKSGDAVFLVLAKHISQNIKNLKGNIVLSFNPVEENLHTGIIEVREVLEELEKKYNLKYILAINNDYICPLKPGDMTKQIYTGSVGKMLPCFYIQGKETHVGQCFEGFDASLVASKLIEHMNLNTDFCEEYNGEYTLPPSVLKMKDLKDFYNVQTSFSSFVYFNYFIHNESTNNIVTKLKGAASYALDEVENLINKRYEKYCKLLGNEYIPKKYNKEVLSYDELVQKASEKYNGDLDMLISDITEVNCKNNTDLREIPLEIVKALCNIAKINNPTIVVFFAAPYCPHNTLKKECNDEKFLYEDLVKIIKKFEKESNEKYEIYQFFPSLTDSSYLKIDDDEESINLLIKNFPMYSRLYNVPLKEIRKLNIPAVNYGCFGKDAHKWTERVYMPYSFGVLPKLILNTVDYFFESKEK